MTSASFPTLGQSAKMLVEGDRVVIFEGYPQLPEGGAGVAETLVKDTPVRVIVRIDDLPGVVQINIDSKFLGLESEVTEHVAR